MGAKKFGIKRHKHKPRPKPVINYPPVPTKKWIPPDQRKKPPKREIKYKKPEGITQKLAISTLKKVWNQYTMYGDAAVLTGNFSQCHRRFTFKSNGLQGAANSAMACVYSQLYKMASWTSNLLDEILIKGDELFIRSTQQGDKCLIEVPPEKLHTWFFLGNRKIIIFVSPKEKATEELTSTSEAKAKIIIEEALEKFLQAHPMGIFYIKDKYAAIWVDNEKFYYFDPGEHDETGNPWQGVPGKGVCFLGGFKKISSLVEFLFNNFPAIKEGNGKFSIVPCGIARMTDIKTTPPETFEDLAPHEVVAKEIIEISPPLPNPKLAALESFLQEDKAPLDLTQIAIEEVSPSIRGSIPGSHKPSFLQDGLVAKHDICRYQIPIPSYLKGEQVRPTYYTELVPNVLGILRATTCQTDPTFSKYQGRQSMGNAISALIMLQICKAKHWIPNTLDTILKYGDLLYRDAMVNIPRTHTLRLADFPAKIEYEGRKFSHEIDEYALVGQLQSQEYDILDLGQALDEFLTDNDCCIVLGPQILAVWIEDGVYYMFDPNERDQEGKAVIRKVILGSNEVNLESPSGVACTVWCQNAKTLEQLYMNNIDKFQKNDKFYLSKVTIKDYEEVSEEWCNFKGIGVGMWILRGSFYQGSFRFSPESRNTQGTANALVALAMSVLFDEQEWSSDTVDEILMSGDALYKASIQRLQEEGLFTSSYLMLTELNTHHPLRDKQAEFQVDECLVNGLINTDNTDEKVPNLRQGLEDFFKDKDNGVLTIRSISIAIWKKNNVYYYLDPHSRDEKGVATGYGTSCSLRLLQLEDVATAIETNLDPSSEDVFNISKVTVILYEGVDEGAMKPSLNHYKAINQTTAILRGWLSDQNVKYESRRGRQTVPMCIIAVGFNRLKPASDWTPNDVDIILDKGDNLYVESMAESQKTLEVPPPTESNANADPKASGDGKPQPGDQPVRTEDTNNAGTEENLEDDEPPEVEVKITSDNVKPEIDVGPNIINLEFSTAADGNIKESLKESLISFYSRPQTDDDFYQDALLETKHYTVALWRDSKVFYLFDPKPRNKFGQVIGNEDWDPEPPEPEPEPEEEEEEVEGEESPEENYDDEQVIEEETAVVEEEEPLVDKAGEEIEEEEENVEEEEEEELEVEEVIPPRPKMSPSYWLEQEKAGRACTIWFFNLEDMAEFIYNNIPVKDRLNSDFSLKAVKVANNLKVKSKYRPGDDRIDVYDGNWYDFTEVEHGKWILRASMDMSFELFPEQNRGRQGLTCSLMALAIAHTFEITCFVKGVVDSILVYGDKLYTFIKKSMKKQLLSDPTVTLQEDEIDWLIQYQDVAVKDIPKKICVSQFMAEVTIVPNCIVGDTKAQNFEDVLDVKRGLEHFFTDSTYGILTSKNFYVAVWKGARVFYMFDGQKRGPNGVHSTAGTGCITRYVDLDRLVEVFLLNLPTFGKSEFVIHKVSISRNLCPRSREPKVNVVTPKAVPKSAGLTMVVPGKSIIRGSINQEDGRFGKAPNAMSVPIAVIALTMSLVHKPENWTKPIIDDIILLGSELYEASVNQLGFNFNPWEEQLDIYRVNKDFRLGVVKANCELRNTDQRGYIDIKDGGMQNLRQGMERFFEENTHGVLVTAPLTVALWEQKQDEGNPLIYIFDPNPRSSTGMPLFGGTACALAFVNAKMASDHIIGCILDPELRAAEFLIVPVEIVVGSARTIRKMPEKSPTRSSINILPRCSKQTASEQKRILRKLADEDRRKKQAKKQEMVGRNGYHIKGVEAILRGYKSQNSNYYDAQSRNKQDIPNCIASVVMHSVLSIEDWNYRHIDLILDTGDQLFIDSYIAYGPKDPKLGMENILRKFFMGNLEIHVTIYKPVITELFTASKLNIVLEAFFQQEPVCILSYNQLWVSLFFKGGFYFMFDPHERSIDGNLVKNEQSGSAVVVRFDNLNNLTLKLVNNLGGNTDNGVDTFSLWIISVESK